jgi:hypothetical protein
MDEEDPPIRKADLAQHECEIELFWRQNSAGEWLAVLGSRKTRVWRQVSSQRDLWKAVWEILGSEVAPSALDLPMRPE